MLQVKKKVKSNDYTLIVYNFFYQYIYTNIYVIKYDWMLIFFTLSICIFFNLLYLLTFQFYSKL